MATAATSNAASAAEPYTTGLKNVAVLSSLRSAKPKQT